MFYLASVPAVVQRFFPKYIWKKSSGLKKLYLTFDDGPHPEHTLFVLDELKKYNAKATFFCIGKNVALYPTVYKKILDDGHSVGNHTHNHLNGSNTSLAKYLENINEAKKYIDSNLFRPPYGRITRKQAKVLTNFKIIMWTVLSADFDVKITKEKCLQNVIRHTKAGAIILFHDSEKAAERMRFALPNVLKKYTEMGYGFCKL
jgi:peptidoglycan-N-acetylglucosamine deacetylase